jgi:hypothetical protein
MEAKTMALSHPLEPWKDLPPGYSRYASFITSDPNKSCTIFRRFDRSNARNLLILESIIADLEEKLDKLEEEALANPDLAAGLQSWTLLVAQVENHADPAVKAKAARIVSVTKDLGQKLENYCKYVPFLGCCHSMHLLI